jgi:AcrR family transcriptional regulator
MVKPKSSSHRTNPERSAATRSALVKAARELFATQGYSGTPREEIVARAGVTRGALQHHFRDKATLFLAVYEQIEQEVVEAVTAAAAQAGDDPVAELQAGCRAYLDAVLDPAVQRICAIDGPAVLASDIRQEITDRYALGLVRAALDLSIERGQIEPAPVEALARVLLAGVTAAAEYVATSQDPVAAREDAGRTVELILDQLRRRNRP